MTAPNPLALASTETLRNATLEDLVALLRAQADVKYDVVVNAKALRYEAGLLVIDGGALRMLDDGVEEADARLRPTTSCEEDVAAKLEIPTRYMRKMRGDAIAAVKTYEGEFTRGDGTQSDEYIDYVTAGDLLDHNVNHWLRQDPSRKFLVRGFRTDDPNEVGIARAVLSDQFGMYDHLDMLVAALDGVQQSGTEIHIEGCDLTENRMQVRVSAPAVKALAPDHAPGPEPQFEPDVIVGYVRSPSDVLRLLVYSTLALALLGITRCTDRETVPRYHQAVFLAALVILGVMLGQAIRRARKVAEEYAERCADRDKRSETA